MDHQVQLPPLPDVPSPNLFLSLAPELKQHIFSALPNAETLKSLVLTCSLFYRTFLDAEHLIIKSILHTQIGPNLLCDAISVFESRKLVESDDGYAAIAILKLYAKQNPACLSQKFTLRDALAIGGLHDDISSFSRGFASSALSTNPVTGLDDKTPSPLSMLESTRIKRTFYRYELFCNMFRGRSGFQFAGAACESLQRLFFSVCAPWENEQLSCLRDYLHEQLSLPFDDVAKHDVEWGYLEMDYLDGFDWRFNSWKEAYLSLGLAYLHKVIDASAYDERCQLLKTHRDWEDCSLHDALTEQPDDNGLPELEDYTIEDERAHIPAQLAIDSDKGPKDAWRWAYAENTNAQWYNGNEQGFLRQRGYVMWDSARLGQWGLLDQEWRELPRESVSDEEERRRAREMRDSFEARRTIWSRGGRGWWSPGDESRIIWPPPQRPRTMASKQCWGNRKVWATDWETWRENL